MHCQAACKHMTVLDVKPCKISSGMDVATVPSTYHNTFSTLNTIGIRTIPKHSLHVVYMIGGM